jgi:CheY-like chemotaxis protein
MDRARILLADDSEEVREFFAAMLDDAGYFVEQASDGVEAWHRIQRQRPDLIILDVVMPRMDGLELMLKMRSDLKPPLPPVLLCSGFEIGEREALRLGAKRFLAKPVEAADLLRAVDETLDGRTPEPEALEAERTRTVEARRRARDDAAVLMRQIDSSHRGERALFQRRAGEEIEALVGYLGVEAGFIALMEDECLVALAASARSSLLAGSDVGTRMPASYQVLESGSSLALADAQTHPALSARRPAACRSAWCASTIAPAAPSRRRISPSCSSSAAPAPRASICCRAAVALPLAWATACGRGPRSRPCSTTSCGCSSITAARWCWR